jgi:REP element-mobilizing transposase RayT
LLQSVKFWKSATARNWITTTDTPVWQRHFWDTQLRRSESYNQNWQYVVENPVRAEWVTKPEDWRYQGEMNILQW